MKFSFFAVVAATLTLGIAAPASAANLLMATEGGVSFCLSPLTRLSAHGGHAAGSWTSAASGRPSRSTFCKATASEQSLSRCRTPARSLGLRIRFVSGPPPMAVNRVTSTSLCCRQGSRYPPIRAPIIVTIGQCIRCDMHWILSGKLISMVAINQAVSNLSRAAAS